jgi:hypothetical protein
VTIVEIGSRSSRDDLFKYFGSQTFQDPKGKVIKINRARSNVQKNRNDMLKKAKTIIEKSAPANDKNVQIVWKLLDDPTSQDQVVTVDDEVAFRQKIQDSCGIFVGPVTDLQL